MIIADIWHAQPGSFFCLSTKSVSGSFKDHWFNRSQFTELRNFLRKNADRNVYFCPHGFSKKERKKEFAVLPHLLWADLDNVDPDVIDPRPTVAIRSSPGRHVGLWMMDGDVTEELNRRLSYAIGSDKSGWDLTQLLRCPGSINHKYAERPQVKVLWRDGPGHAIKRLLRVLPEAPAAERVEPTEAASIYSKWEKELPHWVRKELMTKRPPPEGKRSEMLYKMANTLLECGVPRDDGVAMLSASLWNKYEGRRDEDRQLGRTWDKATNKHMVGGKLKKEKRREDPEEYQYLSLPLSDVEQREIDWLWYPYLARGEVTILQGDPGAGKSFLAQTIAGHITAGRALPVQDPKEEREAQGYVAYFDVENSPDTVTKPRMVDNGFGSTLRYYLQEVRRFSIDSEEEREQVWEALRSVKPLLAVFDTINTYIGKADTNQGAQTQQNFMWFRDMAQEFNMAVLVLRHLTKGSREKAMYRGQGSIAFTGVARIELTAGHHPEEEDMRVVAMDKTNLAPFPKALTYEIATMRKGERNIAKFEFGAFCDLTAEDIVSALPTRSKGTEVVSFLEEALKDGPVSFEELVVMGEARSFSVESLRRAARSLNVRRRGKRWSLRTSEE